MTHSGLDHPSDLVAGTMSFRYVSTLALILIRMILSGCEWIEFIQGANRLRAMSDSTQHDTTTTDVVTTEDANGGFGVVSGH